MEPDTDQGPGTPCPRRGCRGKLHQESPDAVPEHLREAWELGTVLRCSSCRSLMHHTPHYFVLSKEPKLVIDGGQ